MLTQLSIEDFAIVDRLELEFGDGLTVLTGETGAGKSIVVDALMLALGGRGSPDFVRAGAERAAIGASFDLARRPDLAARLAAMGVECDGQLALRRTIGRDGRSRVWMGGTPATVAMLAEIGAELVDFHGQHEHQSLRERRVHRALLDAFAGAEAERAEVARLYEEVRAAEEELALLRAAERGRAERTDFLRFQIGELEEASLRPGELGALETDQRRLANVERLRESAGGALELLAGDERPAADLVREAAQLVGAAAAADDSLEDLRRRVLGALAEIDDLAEELRRYVDDLEADPERLAEVEARLAVLHRLGRKHGATVEEMIAKLEDMRRELDGLEGGEARAEAIEKSLGRRRAELAAAADRLTATRTGAAKRLARAVEGELARLRMERTVFVVQVAPRGEIGPQGADRVEFLMAPNAGEEPKALTKIASGGELSRAMLAIKKSLLGVAAPPTLIFDEVDVGIGGETAAALGDLLAEVAGRHQLLVITHLAQIAARGGRHLRVLKEEREGRTFCRVEALDGDPRVREVARMLGGERHGPASLTAAEEMLASGRGGAKAKGKRR